MSLSIVAGFFLGLIISIVKFDAPEMIVLCTMICTVGLYLIVTLCASLYMAFIDYNDVKLNANKLDKTLDFYRTEFDRKEKEVLGVRKYLKHSLSTMNDDG